MSQLKIRWVGHADCHKTTFVSSHATVQSIPRRRQGLLSQAFHSTACFPRDLSGSCSQGDFRSLSAKLPCGHPSSTPAYRTAGVCVAESARAQRQVSKSNGIRFPVWTVETRYVGSYPAEAKSHEQRSCGEAAMRQSKADAAATRMHSESPTSSFRMRSGQPS